MILWKGYLRYLESNPILTKAITSGTLVGIGDSISQIIEKRSNPQQQYEINRTLRMSLLGFSFFGTSLHFWYKLLEHYIPGKSFSSICNKVVLDQTVYTMTFLFIFFTSIGFMEGKSWEQIRNKQEKVYWQTLKYNWYIWIPANIINYGFVPISLRVLFVSSVALVWNTMLSKIQHKND